MLSKLLQFTWLLSSTVLPFANPYRRMVYISIYDIVLSLSDLSYEEKQIELPYAACFHEGFAPSWHSHTDSIFFRYDLRPWLIRHPWKRNSFKVLYRPDS